MLDIFELFKAFEAHSDPGAFSLLKVRADHLCLGGFCFEHFAAFYDAFPTL